MGEFLKRLLLAVATGLAAGTAVAVVGRFLSPKYSSVGVEEVYVPEDKLREKIDMSLAYLSERYGVSEPSWSFGSFSDDSINAEYSPLFRHIVFSRVNSKILTHEFGHHLLTEKTGVVDEDIQEDFAKNFEKEHSHEIYWIWCDLE